MRKYQTRQDVIEQEIIPSLGPYAGDYDVETICQRTYGWVGDGFACLVGHDAYWGIVQAFEITTRPTSADA